MNYYQPSETERKTVKEFTARLDDLRSARANHDATWREITRHFLPSRMPSFGQAVAGTPGTETLYNAIGVYAAGQLSNAMTANLVNPSMKWVHFAAQDMQEEKRPGVRAWLDYAQDDVQNIMSSDEIGFVAACAEFMRDLTSLHTAVMFAGERPSTGVYFMTVPISQCYVAEDAYGKVDTLYHVRDLSGRQAKDFYGDDVARLDLDDDKDYSFLHATEPDARLGGTRYRSVHVCIDKTAVIREGYFTSFPWLVARWEKMSGEVYGTGPSFEVLPEVRMLQEMSKAILQGAQQAVRPSYLVPDNGFIAPLRARPGSMNVYRPMTAKGGSGLELLPTGQVDAGDKLVTSREALVLRAFYVDVFRALTLREGKSPLSATEAAERVQEAMQVLTPIVSRVHHEFLAPLVALVAGYRQRFWPPWPGTPGARLKTVFLSPAQVAQRANDANSILRFFASLLPIAQVVGPQALFDKVDLDAAIDKAAQAVNLPSGIIRDSAAVKKIRDARIATAKEAADATAAGSVAQNALNLAAKQAPRQSAGI